MDTYKNPEHFYPNIYNIYSNLPLHPETGGGVKKIRQKSQTPFVGGGGWVKEAEYIFFPQLLKCHLKLSSPSNFSHLSHFFLNSHQKLSKLKYLPYEKAPTATLHNGHPMLP